MSKKDKLIKKLKSIPKDFTYDEMVTLLELLGYVENNKGKTSGSAVVFIKNKRNIIAFHKPHPSKEIKIYVIKQVIAKLTEEGLI